MNTAGLSPQSMAPATLIVPPTDDFGGDNSSDILLQQNSGQLVLWEMIGTGVDPSINSGGLTFNGTAVFLGSDYRFLGTGDLNGDGRGDVLWQHATDGAIILWDMNGRAIDPSNSGGVTLNGNAVSLGSDWHYLGTADFNDDGRSDMLWQNVNSGAIVLWQMNGTAIDPNNSGGVTFNGNAVSLGSDWHFLGTGDFSGDGTSDILWQNVNSGAVVLWDMNGGAINPGRSGGLTYNGSPVALGPDWHFVETGDLSGDNTSDILWQNVNGTFALWEMNGTTIDPGSGGGLTYNGNAIALGSDWHALV